MEEQKSAMVQYGVWPNCCNDCDFCLREQRIPYSYKDQLMWLDLIKENINYVDWKNKFNFGISLLGGELYHITDKVLQDKFLELIDVIIDKILLVSKNPDVKYSTVTNGIYEPTFLYKCIDKIVERVGIQVVDINFSYDLKYRFKTEERRKLCLKNINDFHKKYNYRVGVQMILTQFLIDKWKAGEFDVVDFIENQIPGNGLAFLYPHKIHTGKKLDDFQFKREDLIDFLVYLKANAYEVYQSFMLSTMNSGTFKYTGLINKMYPDPKEQPVLSNGKEILQDCGHSILYNCYADSDKCVLCDLFALDEEVFL